MKTLILCLSLLLGSNSLVWAQCAAMDDESGNSPNTIDNNRVPFDQTVRQLVRQLNSFYGTNHGYSYFDDSASHNCYASQEDGDLHLGTNMLAEALQGANGVAGMCYVLAHEFGHFYQYDHSDESLLDDSRSPRYGELQADFMAGYAMARLNYINNLTYRQVLQQAWYIGDPNGRWRAAGAHGTGGERSSDTSLGVQHRTDALEDAYAWSYTWLAPRIIGPGPKMNWLVQLDNGQYFRMLYGGAMVDMNGQQIGQVSAVPDRPYFLFNFTQAGTLDLIGDPSTGLVYWVGQLNRAVGRFQTVPAN